MKVAVTGASGFIGSRFTKLAEPEFEVIPLSLRNKQIAEINLNSIDVIVHLAGKAHEMGKVNEQLFYDINYKLTKNLAEKAIQENVPHFIYVSTVKVYGDETNDILNEKSPCKPTDAYGKSKLQAEIFLQSLTSKIDVAVVRPALVYGAGVKGNMLRLLHLGNKNIPLPFGNTKNCRSIVYLDNLIELISVIIKKRAAGIFLAADEHPLPTNALITLIKQNLNNKKALVSMPEGMRYILKIIKPDLYKRLFGSFVVDNSYTNKRLNFTPPFTTNSGIKNMVEWFKTSQKNL